MVDRRTVTLLWLLGTAVAVVAVAFGVSLGLERLRDAHQTAARAGERITRTQGSLPSATDLLAARDALRAQIDSESGRFYRAGEMNPYLFGTIVKQKLSSLGLAVQRYQVVDVKGTSYVEYSATGSARAFVTFLRDVSTSPRLWTISSMSVTFRQGSEVVEAVMRIGYAVADGARTGVPAPGSVGARTAPETILPLFVVKRPATPVPVAAPEPKPAPAPQPVPKVPSAAPWLRYMGRSTGPDGSASVYLKDTNSGKVVRAALGATVAGWTLISEDDAGLVLTFGEGLYSVSKR